MNNAISLPLAGYLPAFEDSSSTFLYYYTFADDGGVIETAFTRGEFWTLARRAAAVLLENECSYGECFALCFGANHYLDLAFRMAAAMTGAVPVTINWQADTVERIVYKAHLTGCRLILDDGVFERETLDDVRSALPGIPVFSIESVHTRTPLPENEFCRREDFDEESTKIIIFTSGTTGEPKGVQLPYRSYVTNRATFESFLDVPEDARFATIIANPLHHTNSTAICDWSLRRPGTHLHLVERYSTPYWKVLTEAAARGYDRMAAPLVARHFDYLNNLIESENAPVAPAALGAALSRTDVLIGSAPVGPTTVKRFLKLSGGMPRVRFGSTETCLQVLGIPHHLSHEVVQDTFERGWNHEFGGELKVGYYIGRPHPPHTEVRVAKSTTPGEQGDMVACDPGEPGYLVTRGGNLMSSYVKNPQATASVFRDGWYTGLGDVCFALPSPIDGEQDYFWMSRSSSLLVRGGANYSGAQIAGELKSFIMERYELPADAVEVAVIGLKIESEHEDSCCVAVELLTEDARMKRTDIEATFLGDAPGRVSKGSRPDRLCFMPIPRNFKGAIQTGLLTKAWQDHLSTITEN